MCFDKNEWISIGFKGFEFTRRDLADVTGNDKLPGHEGRREGQCRQTGAARGVFGIFHPRDGRADFVTAHFHDADQFKTIIRHDIIGRRGINTFIHDDKRAVLIAIGQAAGHRGKAGKRRRADA